MLDTQGYRHTLRICNTDCFSMAIMATRNRLNIRLCLHCLPFWMLILMVHKVICTPYIFNNVKIMLYFTSSKHISVLHREKRFFTVCRSWLSGRISKMCHIYQRTRWIYQIHNRRNNTENYGKPIQIKLILLAIKMHEIFGYILNLLYPSKI
jgi:hypothetical protein